MKAKKKVVKKVYPGTLRGRRGAAKKSSAKKGSKKAFVKKVYPDTSRGRRGPAKKVAAKKTPKKGGKKEKADKPIGMVTHFYNHIKVAVIKFKVPFRAGKTVRFSGATTDFKQAISSIQYEHKAVSVAKKGQSVGVKVAKRVREGDQIFLSK
ncbi:MAG: hypothetical protein Q7S36_02825 [Candidatus Liptonbacteria bacterium]|nr:hypothetical protein [Candidatus Liptonbacteria bacterium]